jgi:hypothetical protein
MYMKWLSGVVSVVFLVACSSAQVPDDVPSGEQEGEAAEEEWTSEIHDDLQVSSLNPLQVEAFCEQLKANVGPMMTSQELKRAGCIVSGHLMANFLDDSLAACENEVAECLEDDDVDDQEIESTLCLYADEMRDCDVTIAEIEQCYLVVFERTLEGVLDLAEMTCEEVITEEGSARIAAAMDHAFEVELDAFQYAECAGVAERCAHLF